MARFGGDAPSQRACLRLAGGILVLACIGQVAHAILPDEAPATAAPPTAAPATAASPAAQSRPSPANTASGAALKPTHPHRRGRKGAVPAEQGTSTPAESASDSAQRSSRKDRQQDEGAGVSFADHLASGGDGPRLISVRSGSFMMGGKNSDELPKHLVHIGRNLAIGVYEVTFADYDKYAKNSGATAPNDAGWGRERRPVINVSWDEAQGYVRWLGTQTGKRYRLLSEAEWEYVARSGTTGDYVFGDNLGNNRASCGTCGTEWDNKKTAPVGSFPANPFGVHDMNGNVWEWVEDCYQSNYAGAPSDGTAPRAGRGCRARVARGGAWNFTKANLRSAVRTSEAPANRSTSFGFRVARER